MVILLFVLLLFAYIVYVHLGKTEKSHETSDDSRGTSHAPSSSTVTKAPSGAHSGAVPSGHDKSNSSTTAEEKSHRTILPSLPEYNQDEELTSVRSRISRTVESLEWINGITRVCWPHIGKIFETELLPVLGPLINAALPAPLSKFTFLRANLGKDPVKVGNVTVHKRYRDSVVMDLDVDFVGSPDIQMKVFPLAAPFGIKELRWSGRLTVLLRPLTPVLPCIGAVQATFVSLPKLSMDFTGVATFAELGPIEKVVHKVLYDVMASTVVLPNRLIFKLSDSVDFFDVYYPPLGVMKVTVKRAQGFEKERKAGLIKLTPDVYVTLELGGEEFKTPVVKKSLNPEWNASHLFLLSDIEQKFKLKAKDWDPVSDDLLGQTLITADSLLKSHDFWTGLTDKVESFAANANILLHSELLVFSNTHFSSQIVVTVIIDRARGLPVNSRSSQCEVKIGNVTKLTPVVVKPKEPTPYVDPVNPVWNTFYDVVLPDIHQANVVLTVLADKCAVGTFMFQASDIIDRCQNEKAGEFRISSGATIRAKVLYRGLVPEGLESKSKQ